MEEKEIMNEAAGYAMEANATLYGDIPSADDTDMIENIFIDGAHWALNHQWIDAQAEVPNAGVWAIGLTPKKEIVEFREQEHPNHDCFYDEYDRKGRRIKIDYWMLLYIYLYRN